MTGVRVKKILPPLNPAAVFCIGINYKAHAAETGMKLPEYPVVFMKNPASVIGHGMPIVLPSSCRDPLQVDYEVELAVIIGKEAKNVPVDKALDYVAGYTVANDVSARTWQANAGARQWIRGKSFDTFCPLGPDLITPEDVTDPDNLNLKCVLNGRGHAGKQYRRHDFFHFPVDCLSVRRHHPSAGHGDSYRNTFRCGIYPKSTGIFKTRR